MRTTFDCGNFEVEVELDTEGLSDGIGKLVMDGITQVLQRKPASDWERAVAGDAWPTGERGGKVRPKSFERSSIPYQSGSAYELQEICKKALEALDLETDFTVRVGEKIAGDEGKSRKMAEKFLADLEEKDAATLAALLMVYGVAADASREEKVEVIHQKVFAKARK